MDVGLECWRIRSTLSQGFEQMFRGDTSEIGLSICPVSLRSANVSLTAALNSVENDSEQDN